MLADYKGADYQGALVGNGSEDVVEPIESRDWLVWVVEPILIVGLLRWGKPRRINR